jgi:hypothetical protein
MPETCRIARNDVLMDVPVLVLQERIVEVIGREGPAQRASSVARAEGICTLHRHGRRRVSRPATERRPGGPPPVERYAMGSHC